MALCEAVSRAPEGSDVVIEATYGWYWAADGEHYRLLGAQGAPIPTHPNDSRLRVSKSGGTAVRIEHLRRCVARHGSRTA